MRRLSYLALLAVPALLTAPGNSHASESGNSDEDEEPAAPAETPPSTKSAPVAFDKKWLDPYFASGPASKAAVHFRAGDFASASKELARVLADLPAKSLERNPLRFLQALALMNQS